jgi:hypothetical protein
MNCDECGVQPSCTSHTMLQTQRSAVSNNLRLPFAVLCSLCRYVGFEVGTLRRMMLHESLKAFVGDAARAGGANSELQYFVDTLT